jgi:hypothetical protein
VITPHRSNANETFGLKIYRRYQSTNRQPS